MFLTMLFIFFFFSLLNLNSPVLPVPAPVPVPVLHHLKTADNKVPTKEKKLKGMCEMKRPIKTELVASHYHFSAAFHSRTGHNFALETFPPVVFRCGCKGKIKGEKMCISEKGVKGICFEPLNTCQSL